MTTRLKMNSQSLKKAFPRVYQEFFSRSMIVTSAPGSFIWAGDYTVMEGGFSLLQKVPVRVYVGLEVNSTGKIELNEFNIFNPSIQNFEQGCMEVSIRNTLTKFISEYFKENMATTGITINVLSEVPACRGMNMSGAISVGLALAIDLLLKKIKASEVDDWNNIDLPTLTRKIDLKFDQVYRLAWKFSSIFHGGVSGGSSAFAPFIKTAYPIIFYSEKRATFTPGEKASNTRFPKDVQGNWRIMDQVFYGGIRFEELFHYKTMPHWPVDFGLIYSGDVRMTATTHISLEEIKDSLKASSNMVKESFAPFLANSAMTPHFYDLVEKDGWRGLWNNYINPTMVVSIEALNAFNELFKKGISENALKNLFAAINRSAEIFRLLNLSSPVLDYICTYFIREMQRMEDFNGVGLKPVGSGKKGDVLFVLSYHGIRDQIFRVLNDMETSNGFHYFLDYASWIDGIEEDGIKIEQLLEDKIYSDFISPGAVLVKHLKYNGFLHTDLYTHEEFDKMAKKVDLILDEVEETIFVKGRQLTSKDIHSSVATISILKELIKKVGEPVANATLPISSYTQDRNELQSKIISPLCKILNTRTKRNLNLKISGGLVNFTVKLGNTGVDIFLIKRVF